VLEEIVDAVFKVKHFQDNLDQKAFRISRFHKQDEAIFSLKHKSPPLVKDHFGINGHKMD
jgi:hypothetical protein